MSLFSHDKLDDEATEPASPTETTATQIVTADDTLALYDEVVAES